MRWCRAWTPSEISAQLSGSGASTLFARSARYFSVIWSSPSIYATACQKTDSRFPLRIERIVWRTGFDLWRQTTEVLIASAASDDLLRIDCGIEVRRECEHLRHVDPVIALKAIPPPHSISLSLVPGGQMHECQIGETSTSVHGYQADPHLFIPLLPKRAGLLSVLWTSSKPTLFILCILWIQINPRYLESIQMFSIRMYLLFATFSSQNCLCPIWIDYSQNGHWPVYKFSHPCGRRLALFITNKIAQYILCDMTCIHLWDEALNTAVPFFQSCYIGGSSHVGLSKTLFGIYFWAQKTANSWGSRRSAYGIYTVCGFWRWHPDLNWLGVLFVCFPLSKSIPVHTKITWFCNFIIPGDPVWCQLGLRL